MKKPSYGIDAPYLIAFFIVVGLLFTALGCGLYVIISPKTWLNYLALAWGLSNIVLIAMGLYMLFSSLIGKKQVIASVIDTLNLNGHETVLDVGCGKGSFLLNVAKRLNTNGHAHGIDIWSQTDLSNNSLQLALKNAALEGAADKVSIKTNDMRDIEFPDNSFDLVVANLAIHNLKARADRQKSLAEIVRVLRPKAKFAIIDFKFIDEYKSYLQQVADVNIHYQGRSYWMFPPVTILMGEVIKNVN